VKCSHCAAPLRLAQPPAGGKVKCPTCGGVVRVPAQSSGRATSRAGDASPAMDPDDDGFDFGRIKVPSSSAVSALSHFPITQELHTYQGPIPGDPLDQADVIDEDDDLTAEALPPVPGAPKPPPGLAAKHPSLDAADAAAGDTGEAERTKDAKRRKVKLFSIGGGTFIVLLLIVGALLIRNNRAAGDPAKDPERLKAIVDIRSYRGGEPYEVNGVVGILPPGEPTYNGLPELDCVSVQSTDTGTLILMGANVIDPPLSGEAQLIQEAERLLGGQVGGVEAVTRSEYNGFLGKLSGSSSLPDGMVVEVFQVDGRFVILAYTMDKPNDFRANTERKDFVERFAVGNRPMGWLW